MNISSYRPVDGVHNINFIILIKLMSIFMLIKIN